MSNDASQKPHFVATKVAANRKTAAEAVLNPQHGLLSALFVTSMSKATPMKNLGLLGADYTAY
jgi:hypothetical protein